VETEGNTQRAEGMLKNELGLYQGRHEKFRTLRIRSMEAENQGATS